MSRNKSVNVHQFAMVPRAEIPRSRFNIQTSHKTTFNAGWLVPIYVDEVLPGDTFSLRMSVFARLATPIVPIMDNLYFETFFFFVPNRLVWEHWENLCGEEETPGVQPSYLVPQITSPVGGYEINTLYDYFGLPTAGQVGASNTVSHSALPLRAYNLIYNEWFRDQNLVPKRQVPVTDGPDLSTLYELQWRGKRHDYFTSALPFLQKGPSVTLPLGTEAPIRGLATQASTVWTAGPHGVREYEGATATYASATFAAGVNNVLIEQDPGNAGYPRIYADLSEATAATINQLRQSFQVQKLLERDARGGTRYTELVKAHFGVVSPDSRLQRPEYLGGGTTPVVIREVPQTSATSSDPSTSTPLGFLGATGRISGSNHSFTQSFTEHGHIIGIGNIRADLNYQQGMRKMWSRRTRYDFYWPVFAMLGEQAILNQEIYCTGDAADQDVFGYQERWAEMRYNPAIITGFMRSTHTATLDVWHLAQHFTALPTLNTTFIADMPPVDRILAVPESGESHQFLVDMFFNIKAARPMPMYSVPGLIDHF